MKIKIKRLKAAMTGMLIIISIPAFCQLTNPVDSIALPQPFAPGIISTRLDDGAISFSHDGNTVYSTQGHYSTIIYSKKVDGHWSKPEIIGFSGTWNDRDPFVSPDNRRIFFISDRPLKGGTDPPEKVLHIWCSERISGEHWGEPRHLDSAVNRGGTGSFAPAVSLKGTLYFCSRRKENPGMQSYYAEWTGDHFAPAKLVVIPGAEHIQDPFIAPDESYLVFLNGKDLYISFRRNGAWAPAQKLGPNVNNGDQNFSPCISQDGKMLYYTSGRISGFYDRTHQRRIETYDELLKENDSIYNRLGNILMVPVKLKIQKKGTAEK